MPAVSSVLDCFRSAAVVDSIRMRDRSTWRQFEDAYARQEHLDLELRFRLLDALYEQARALGLFPPKDPLEGIEHDIRLAQAVNRVSTAPQAPRT